MPKTDDSLRKICIASIKRHTSKPLTFPFTTLFETEHFATIENKLSVLFTPQENELPIVLTHLNADNWTLVTTRRILSTYAGEARQVYTYAITDYEWNDFKGAVDKPVTYGQIYSEDQLPLFILIETGAASMMMIYGIRTLLDIS